MKRASLIRLGFATLSNFATVAFVSLYSKLSVPVARLRDHLELQDFPAVTRLLAEYAWVALLVPLAIMVAGCLAIVRAWRQEFVELAIGSQWSFPVLWLCWCLFVWLLPQLPPSH